MSKLTLLWRKEGKRHCVLHYPTKDKAEDFEQVFRQRIDEGHWDFRMAWFPVKLDFENHTFDHDAKFSSATFAARVRFWECKFEGSFEFFDSKFLDLAEFRYSEPLKSMILQARADFDTWFAAHADEGPEFNQKVRITGVGMFDTLGHAEGTSPNGIELHPVIKIEFLN